MDAAGAAASGSSQNPKRNRSHSRDDTARNAAYPLPMISPIPRRTFLQKGALAALSVAALRQRLEAADAVSGLKGHIHHSVCKWCYPKTSLEDLCSAGQDMGLTSVELLQPADY